ncbi:Solitary outer membrane autotransporter beta-barrel domain [Vibrio mytili]|uniref:Solitary outer membrane autotransporter beta-barrel domain n=1 Tax=Vibrio mytili TaxID=50718 RepID=UPI0006973B31|nr:Solitary outer membrane autotransporter beta-barrel domain [Vibrio mytili]
MKNKCIKSILALVTLSLPSFITNAESVRQQLKKEFEQSFASSIVLSDSDVLTLGFNHFDPNEAFNIENEDIGSRDSIDLRKRVTAYILPYSIDLTELEDGQASYYFNGRFYLLGNEQEVSLDPTKTPDKNKEQVYGGYVEIEQEQQITERISLSGAIGTHLIYYKNNYSYRSDALDEYRDLFEGVYFNTDAWALVGEVNATFKYQQDKNWGRWYVWSSPHYFYGTSWGDANYGELGEPEGWYWVNGIKAFYDFANFENTIQTLYASINRVDIGADTREPINATNYYEASLGWLMTPPFDSDWIDNVGIGLTINYGSALKGGSISLFFNQQ